jgi:nifR3 family TIM-barrel protein
METPRSPTTDSLPTLRIGRLEIRPPVVLAPMAGVTTWPFRKICRDLGAGLCTTEMVSARAMIEDAARTREIAWFGPGESPRSLQIFGSDPGVMAEAVSRLQGEVDVFDINFGCPVPKVTRKGAGAATPARPELCRAVVRAVVRAAGPIPVTVKLRLGLDEDRFTFREAARIAEGEGCAAIGLHARTVAQLYSGRARWEFIRELRGIVRIPVLGNGDVFRASDAAAMVRETGCDGIIVGRGCLGNPWLFRDLRALFDGAPPPPPPALEEHIGIIRLHYGLLREHFTRPRAAEQLLRKFGTWYSRGLRNAAAIRRLFQAIEGPEDLDGILEEMARCGWQDGFRPFQPGEAAGRVPQAEISGSDPGAPGFVA